MADKQHPQHSDRSLLGVSRREMEEYVNARLEALTQGWQAGPVTAAAAAPSPRGLQAAYDQLYRKHEALLASRAARGPPVTSHVSDEAIDAFVKTLLENPAVNLRFVPDALEGAAYRNFLKLLLHAVAHASDTVGFELLGHRVRLVIEPADKSAAPPGDEGGK